MTEDLQNMIMALDQTSWGRVEDAREKLVPLGARIFPVALEVYPRLRGFRARAALLHTAFKFALTEPAAVALGLMGLEDKSAFVREKACLLLAVSGRKDTLPALRNRVALGDPDGHAAAAIAAITEGDRNLYIDRARTGRVTLNIGGLIVPETRGNTTV